MTAAMRYFPWFAAVIDHRYNRGSVFCGGLFTSKTRPGIASGPALEELN
jgi:hypothetical protein